MNNENQDRRKYKRYDINFKRSAVEMWLSGGKSVEQIASELGISTQSIKKWKKELAALPATGRDSARSSNSKRRTADSNANCNTSRARGTF